MVTEEDLEEEEYFLAGSSEEEADEHEVSLEDDEISPEEEGFLRGYESTDEDMERSEEEL